MVALFFSLSFVNTILDNLKDTLVITAVGGGTEVIPYLTVYAVLPCSVLFLVLYSYASQHFSRAALFNGIIMLFSGFFAFFALYLYPNHEALHFTHLGDQLAQALPNGLVGAVGMLRNWTFTLFFCVAELFGDVGLGLLFWGLANDTTAMQDAPVLYPMFGLGANLAQAGAGTMLRMFCTRSDAQASFTADLQSMMLVVMGFSAAIILLHSYITHAAAQRKQARRAAKQHAASSSHDDRTPPAAPSQRLHAQASTGPSSHLEASHHIPMTRNGNGVTSSTNGVHHAAGGHSPADAAHASNGWLHSTAADRNGAGAAASTSSSTNGNGRSALGGVRLPRDAHLHTLSNGNGNGNGNGTTSSSGNGYAGVAPATNGRVGSNGAASTSTAASNGAASSTQQQGKAAAKKKKKTSLSDALRILSSSLEIRCLAVMSLAQGLCSSLMEFSWKSHMRLLYPSPQDFTTFLGDVATCTGAVTGTLMLLTPLLFSRLGWRGVAAATPLILTWGGGAFFAACIAYQHFFGGPGGLQAGAVAASSLPALNALVVCGALLYVFSKGAKFSLFKPAEEMVYIGLGEEGRTKGKAAIDVVGAQAGKAGGSVLQQGLLLMGGGALVGALPVMGVVFVAMTRGWLGAVDRLAGTGAGFVRGEHATVDTVDEGDEVEVWGLEGQEGKVQLPVGGSSGEQGGELVGVGQRLVPVPAAA